MSTMLKTAAMSLLSKTLQTFLSKYLSDVDVEGVALPSLYDKTSSGWGVRLRHVQLREGVQLLEELPGKLKLKRKRKRKPKEKPPKKNKSKAKGSGSEKETIISNVEIQPKPKETVVETKDGASFSELEPNELFHEDEKGNTASDDFSLELQDVNVNESAVYEYYTDDDDNSVGSGQPQTSVQDSKSLFSCFYNSKAKNLHMHRVSSHGEETKSRTYPSSIDTEAVDPSPKIDNIGEHSEAPSHDSYKQSVAGAEQEDETESLGDEDEEEDEYEEYEQPMKLRLGQGGRIGVLDVRLIGKDLHILAEDAFLTIEVVPSTENDGEESEDTDTGGGTDNGGESSSNIPKVAPAPAAASDKKPVPETKRATVGERVLADIALARALSAIPHLFLRDVRIRLIIREEAGTDTLPPEHASPNDTVIEIGIDFLSVTSGDDVLSHFQQQQQQQEEESTSNLDYEMEMSRHAKPPMNSMASFSSVGSAVRDENEYLVRHIRTGRGPEGGIWLKVFAPTHRPPAHLAKNVDSSPKWARQCWFLETDYHLFRMSGLDLQARINLGTKKEVASYAWFYGDYDEEEYDNYTLDSMFWGDNIAPGPQLPLPPIETNMSRGGNPQRKSRAGSIDETAFVSPEVPPPEELLNAHLEADVYSTDKNGIQSSKVRSNFHRITRGMVPGSCRNYNHLPCETCPQCWEAPNGIDRDSSLDSSLPMPGLVLQITLRDPLEINADRASLETIGLLQSLFRKKRPDSLSNDESSEDVNAQANEKDSDTSQVAARDEVTETTVSTSLFSSFLSRRSKEEPKEDPSEAFSPCMQPENIQVIGLHLSEVSIRIHVMRKGRHNEGGLSFCYWDLSSHCITMDNQLLLSKEKNFKDLRFDIGHLTLAEMRGTERKQLISLGIPYPERNRCDSMTSSASMPSSVDDFDTKRAPWPSTACALMAIPPPLETLVYKKRECHGLQMRFISINNPTDEVVPTRSLLDVRLGVTTISMPWALRLEVGNVRREIMSTIFEQSATKDTDSAENERPNDQATESASSKSQKEDVPEAPRPKSLMKYKIQIDSGAISLQPLISLNLPLTQLAGERSTESGLFLESVLQRLQMSCGKVDPSSTLHGKCLSLQQVAALPESLRMRILLLLDDLGPLEEALELKKESNSFQQCRSVNKGLLKMAKKVSKASKSSRRKHVRKAESSTNTRRHELMTEFLRLDDAELEEMWSSHQKNLRKLAKRRPGVTQS